ncbi:MAG: pilus assembly protein PilM [Caldisericaceae bacterium]
MKLKSAGISIGEEAIRVAIVTQDSSGISVERIEEIHYEDFGSLKTNKEVALSLRKIFKNEHISNRVAVSIPDDRIIIRGKSLPPINESKILQLIQTEIKDYAIFSGENVSLGFAISKKEQDKSLIVWGASKESNVINTLQFLRNAGLKTKTIIPSNFALAKAAIALTNEDKPFCVVNVDRDTTSLTFVESGRVVFTYTQDIGFRVFEQNDFAGKNAWVGNIVTTLTYASRTFSLTIKEIFLTVAASKTSNVLEMITQKVPYPVIMLNVPQENIQFKDEEVFVRLQATGGNEFACAIGLALLNSAKHGDPLRLSINEHFLRERSSDRLKVLATIIVLVAINGAAFAAYPILDNALHTSEVNIAKVEKSISDISVSSEDATKLSQQLQDKKGLLAKFKDTKTQLDSKTKLSSVLQEISFLRPTGLSLLSVAIGEDGKISIRGSGTSISNVLSYEENLAKAKYVSRASIGNIERGDSSQGFVFDMQLFVGAQQ